MSANIEKKHAVNHNEKQTSASRSEESRWPSQRNKPAGHQDRWIPLLLAFCLSLLPAWAQALPDLAMTAISSPSSTVTSSLIFTVNDTVLNQGDTATTTACKYVGYYLSTDNLITTADTRIGARNICSSIAAGASNSVTGLGVSVPPSLPLGTYYLGAIADYTGAEPESDETNNALASTTITVGRADLIMSAVSTTSTQVTSGANFSISDTITNQGSGPTSNACKYIGYYLSTDNLITTADTLVGSRIICSGIAAGASNVNNGVSAFMYTSIAPGTYYLGAIADNTGAETEISETNNALTGPTITVVRPDLVMSALTPGTTAVMPGGSFTVADTLSNPSTTATNNVCIQVGYYLSTDNNITTADTLLGTRTVCNGLAAGASSTASATSLSISSGQAIGTYYLGAIADHNGNVAETDENNNALSAGTLTIARPDLVMSALGTTATSVNAGTNISVSDTLTNQGSVAASTTCKSIGYYLSTDNNITTADTRIGSRDLCTSLGAGASDSRVTTISVPTTQTAGTYYLGAIADYTGTVVESNETNNTLTGPTLSIRTVPGAPINVSASSGNTQVTVTFSAPANDGGTPITGYTVSASPAGGVDSHASSTSLTHVITGLTNGTAYTFTVKATNAIGTSAASAATSSITPATVPGAPGNVSATAGNAQASVTFTAPTTNGGAPITGYTVSSSPAGGIDSNAGTTGLTHTITGLANGTAYTFTVTASNTAGTGQASLPSASITPATVPDAPTQVTATAGDSIAMVTFTAPANHGGLPITGYTVSTSPAGGVDSHAGSSGLTHLITGLTNGTAYTFTVTASNAVGSSAASAPSNSVTPALATAQDYYIHTDHLNTPRSITDTAGNTVWQWDNSDPFGNNMPNENPNGLGRFEFNKRFEGQYFDKETNLHYNVNRDYDPANGGRYIESDPIGLMGGINTYGYVEGNPLSYVDPTGEAATIPRPRRIPVITPGNGTSTPGSGADLDDMPLGGSALSRDRPTERPQRCERPDDEKCDPPEGTMCSDFHKDSTPHTTRDFDGNNIGKHRDHVHIWKMNKSPKGCIWNRAEATNYTPVNARPCNTYPSWVAQHGR